MTDDVYAASKTVDIPSGTGVPGCETTSSCWIPSSISINLGDIVTWKNSDSAAHTVTSGSPTVGPDGIFDSSLLMAGATFEVTFDDSGRYDYFCMVHPWMTGVVIVQATSIASSTPEIKFSRYNSIHGFSLNYPSGWYIDDVIIQSDYQIDYVWFTPKFNDYETMIKVIFYPDDFEYSNLSDRAYESKLASDYEEVCYAATLNEDGYVCRDFDLFTTDSFDDADGNTWHLVGFGEEDQFEDGTTSQYLTIVSEMSIGKDTWSVLLLFEESFFMQNEDDVIEIAIEAVTSFSLAGTPTPTINYYNTKLTLQVLDGSSTGYVQVYPKLTYGSGDLLGTPDISIYVGGIKKTQVSSNQWSSNIFVGDGTHTIRAGFSAHEDSKDSSVTYRASTSNTETFSVGSSPIISPPTPPPPPPLPPPPPDYSAIYAVIGVIVVAVVGVGIALSKRKKVAPVITAPPAKAQVIQSKDDTQFWVCPNCGQDTQMKDGRQYCSSCKIYL